MIGSVSRAGTLPVAEKGQLNLGSSSYHEYHCVSEYCASRGLHFVPIVTGIVYRCIDSGHEVLTSVTCPGATRVSNEILIFCPERFRKDPFILTDPHLV